MKIYAPIEAVVKDWNPKHNRVTKSTKERKDSLGNTEVEVIYEINCKDIVGLTRVEYKPQKAEGQIEIEMSSKILKCDYYKHINKNTIEQAFQNV
ncbi:MAG TPA: hypothetical protein PLG47_05220, partial [Candidatus Dojkabacteria bacterium]|nr:hypothetical protein [Candidatus Dojkabacteria bacterium]